MAKRLKLTQPCADVKNARIGGKALIGGVVDWPKSPDQQLLTLIMSIPTEFLNTHAGFQLPNCHFISVFSYYSESEYFLDCITYHGTQAELDIIRKGYTKVMFHSEGSAIDGSIKIPPIAMEVDDRASREAGFQESKIGGAPDQLQPGSLSLNNQRFALQLYGDLFPDPYKDIFFLSDALGYLFVDDSLISQSVSPVTDAGTFFVQVT